MYKLQIIILTIFVIFSTACSSGGKNQASTVKNAPEVNVFEIDPAWVAIDPAPITVEKARSLLGMTYELMMVSASDANSISWRNYLRDAEGDSMFSEVCAVSGSIDFFIQKSARKIISEWHDCKSSSDYKITGLVEISLSDVIANSNVEMRVVYDSYRIEGEAHFEMQDGIISYVFDSIEAMNYESIFNMRFLKSNENPVYVYNLKIKNQGLGMYAHNTVQAISGIYAQDEDGFVEISLDPETSTINVNGSDRVARMKLASAYADFLVQPVGQTISEAGVRVLSSELQGLIESVDALADENSAPYVVQRDKYGELDVDYLYDGYLLGTTVSGVAFNFSAHGLFGDSNLDLLVYDAQVIGVSGIEDSEYYNERIPEDAGQSSLTKADYADFKFLAKDPGLYAVSISASDTFGLTSPQKILKIFVLPDSDSDGIADIDDPDIDNDGQLNHVDIFPFDPLEHSDFDGDGIGDNADPDDDNDEVSDLDDYYPLNALCFKSLDGDGERCYVQIISSWKRVFDGTHLIFFYKDDSEMILLWDIDAESFLPPLQVSVDLDSEEKISDVKFSNDHARLYIAYSSGRVSYFNKKDLGVEVAFLNANAHRRTLDMVGPYVFSYHVPVPNDAPLLDYLRSPEIVEVYDVSGDFKDTITVAREHRSRYVYDPMQNAVYGGEPGFGFDVTSASFGAEVQKFSARPILFSPDKTLSLREDSAVYNAGFGDPIWKIEFPDSDWTTRAVWWLDAGIVYKSPADTFNLYDESGSKIAIELPYAAGRLIDVFGTGKKLIFMVDESQDRAVKFYVVELVDKNRTDLFSN